MSTITVVKKDGFVAIAADTLTKFGSAKESATYIVNHEKIIRVGDSFLAVTGASSFKTALRHLFSDTSHEARLHSVMDIYGTWMMIHEKLKESYFLNANDDSSDSVETTRIDVLIANPYGIFGVSEYRHVQEFSRFYSYGVGDEYAMGAMYAVYDSERSALEIARLGVEAAAEFDDATGLPILSHEIRLKDAPQDDAPPT